MKTEIKKASCPLPPECVLNRAKVRTNGELVQALQDAEHSFYQCKIARDALARCVQ